MHADMHYLDDHEREEVIHFDSRIPPVQFLNDSAESYVLLGTAPGGRAPADSILHITSTGRYCEGSRFHSFHHGFANFGILVTLSGQGIFHFDHCAMRLCRGDVIFYSHFEHSCSETVGEEWSWCMFNLAGDPCLYYDRIWNRRDKEIIHVENPERYDDYRRRIDRVLSQSRERTDIEVNLLLTTMICELLRERDQADGITRENRPSWIDEATSYIAANYNDNSKISAIAEHFSFSSGYFTRQFRKHTGRTPKEYQTLCRVDEAALLLRGTALPVVEIASRTGFSSHSRLTEVFRRIYGQSPSDYRKKRCENR